MKKIPQLKVTIRNQDDVPEIDIDGEIGWVNENGEWNTPAKIKDKLKEISKLEASKIIVNINSLGGFVDDGLAIHDVLAQHEAEIETRVVGMTASAATIIAQAGDKRFMSDNSLYLIHKAWGLGIGNANDMLALAQDLETIDERIVNIYVKRSGKSEAEIDELMQENNGGGKWIDADEALEFGLIDEAFEPMKAAASVDVDTLKNSGLPIPYQLFGEEDGEKFEGRLTNEQIFEWMKSDKRVKDFLKDQFNEIMEEYDSDESEEEVPEGITLEDARNMEIETII